MTERVTLLGGRYEVGAPLGQGGMAEVLRGRDTRLGRDVAVKILRPELASDPTFIARFRREAQAAASLNHPNIVSVFDTGDDSGTPFIVMEYVEGRTLRDILRTQGRMMPQRALEIVADVCAALEHAHQQGLVHRDIKPANVMINSAGTVKVMDFGIARALSASSTMTQTAAVVGTAQYLSPEQARGEHVDARSDVYSTGCLLYELLTHQPPFTGDSPVAVAYQHVLEDPDLPSTLNPDIEPAVEAVVMKAMAKNPGNRYQTAAEMRDDLLRAAAGRAVRATPILSAADTTLLTPAAASTTVLTTTPPADRRNRRVVAYALLALATIAVFVGSLMLVRSLFDDSGTAVRVPDVRGRHIERATQLVAEAGFTVGEITHEFHPTAPVGIVFEQEPLAGFSARRGDKVNLTVSRGVEQVQVPDVTGQQLEDARADLEGRGLKIGRVTEKEQVGPPGRVLAVDPKPGTTLAKGSTVNLTVISGQITVPDVFGKTFEEARRELEAVGFGNIAREDVPTDNPAEAGTVVEQDPRAGSKADRDARIVLRVAQPPPTTAPATTPPPTESPTPTGEPPLPPVGTGSPSMAPAREDDE